MCAPIIMVDSSLFAVGARGSSFLLLTLPTRVK